jgi:putative heme-binding domain-containing protein
MGVRQAMTFSPALAFLGVLILSAAPVLQTSRADDPPAPSRWGKEIAAFERQDQKTPPPKNAIVFVGSSSIRFWDLRRSFPGMDVINRGFGGSQLADSVALAPRLILKYEPRMVILYAGENDIGFFGKTPEQVAADFRLFVRIIHQKLPKTKIVFLSIKPSPQRWRLIDKMRQANHLIEAECQRDERLLYVDVASALLAKDGKPARELFVADGLHLSAKGYQVWTAILEPTLAASRRDLFARENLVAWCIVPFDAKKRGPEERAAMLARLGFKRFAYDWRAEHVPTFDAELDALGRHGIKLEAFWLPAALDADGRRILDLLRRHKIGTQLWVTMGDPGSPSQTQTEKIEAAARILRPIAEEAAKIDCKVGLYNHGGWFGEPENQLAILDHLGLANVGLVYNLHHGHDQVDRLPELLGKMLPHLYAVNLNGMSRGGDRVGRKILPLGQGELDVQLLRVIRNSGYRGPIGILGHTMNDAEDQLRDNLDGLEWLRPQLDGKPAGPRPKPRTPVPPAAPAPVQPTTGKPLAYDRERVSRLVAQAQAQGNARRGALVFRAAQFACLSCHRIGKEGGTVGPDLTLVGRCLPPAEIVESVLWPKRQVKEGYMAWTIVTRDGRLYTGYKERETKQELHLRDPAQGLTLRIALADIEEQQQIGSLMPDGLAEAMSPEQLRDLLCFLLELGRAGSVPLEQLLSAMHEPASFPYDRAPLQPENWPSWRQPVNRDRLYDFYAKEADYFQKHPGPPLLPEYPGLDGGKYGHWGNQDETTWADSRWNLTELGSVMCGIFRAPGVVVPKAVCLRLGEHGELSACFNPQTLSYEALWQGGFVKFSPVRHGFLDGLLMEGKLLPRPAGSKPAQPFVYHGFYRHGKRVLFSYRIGDVEMLDAPWVEGGQFTRLVAPAREYPLAGLTRGGPAQWPQVLQTRGTHGTGGPYVVDNITPPFANPWKAPLFCGDHDFLPDGTAFICTMQGDVWRVEGLDEGLEHIRWRRFASGLHHALGLVIADGQIYVQGRDQITRLHDLNGDGEADFYECFSNAYTTSSAGHDFICGLQRDAAGRFYTVSGNQGLVRISADGQRADVLATGFRNPDGLGLLPDGTITVPCSEGEWTPASMICEVRPGTASPAGSSPPFFGYRGPRNGRPPELPLVYVPRGLDNSSGAQVYVPDRRWGPLQGQLVHFSYGAASHFLLLREEVGGQPQGAIVPLPGEFLSGVHRGRFNPHDGQLYVSGMAGWGTYSVADGCFQRVRYTGQPVQLPCAFHVHENGVRLSFTRPVDRAVAEQVQSYFAQAWNYRYSSAYGSPEFSARHIGTPGHDPLTITAAHVLADGQTIFLEIPDLQPVNQLHLHLCVDAGRALDLFGTVHRLGAPFTAFAGYRPVSKQIAAHPILSDLARMTPAPPNPWRKRLTGARAITIEADKNLTFAPRQFTVRAGESIRLTFVNPDVVPHNWLLLKPGSLQRVGALANKLVAEPDAATRQYVPRSEEVLVYTDVVAPRERFTIYFQAPREPGRYPFLCAFPGHWMVMNGQMTVE